MDVRNLLVFLKFKIERYLLRLTGVFWPTAGTKNQPMVFFRLLWFLKSVSETLNLRMSFGRTKPS